MFSQYGWLPSINDPWGIILKIDREIKTHTLSRYFKTVLINPFVKDDMERANKKVANLK